MLDLPHSLPAGALCAAHPEAVDAAMAGASWWHGAPDEFATDPKTGAVTLWRNHLGGPPALPTPPNDGNGLMGEAGGLTGLQCRTGLHCGLAADRAATTAQVVTVAMRFYAPPGEDARTLWTLNTAGLDNDPAQDNYLFATATDATLTVKDDMDLVDATLPCPPVDHARLMILSLSSDRMTLWLDGETLDTQARAPVLSGAATLFLGCRNHRPRLLKTLGAALLLDVWLWPGRALLHSDLPEDRAALAALHRHHLWAAD